MRSKVLNKLAYRKNLGREHIGIKDAKTNPLRASVVNNLCNPCKSCVNQRLKKSVLIALMKVPKGQQTEAANRRGKCT